MAAVSRHELASMGLDPRRLIRGDVWQGLHDNTFSWVSSYLIHDGMDEYRAREAATLAAQILCEQMNEYVLDNFHDPMRRGANGHRVPTSVVMSALEQSIPISV